MILEADVTRPIIRYHGGKWKLAKWIISHLPPHRIYTETFGGAASVLLRKKRSYAEIYNDLDGDVVNLFRIARSRGFELKEQLYLTPFSREEFDLAYQVSTDELERARRTVIRAYQGFGSAGASQQKTGFRSCSNRSGTTPAHDWANFPATLDGIIERLRGVVIEHKDAYAVMQQHDSAQTLHYVDPPYVLDTRSKGQNTKCYRFEMDNDEHASLLTNLQLLTGMIVLSGYRHPIYDELLPDWLRIDRAAHADGAKDRIESLWLNPQAQQHIKQTRLFA